VSFLLDTNAISEWQKPQPNAGVVTWMAGTDEDHLFLSVATLAEIRYGIERMPNGGRRSRYEHWLEFDLLNRFDRRILPVDEVIADAWGRIVARASFAGKPINAIDGFLAATAEVYSLTLVTCNVQHFTVLKTILNPWT
jgi:toxin FitB